MLEGRFQRLDHQIRLLHLLSKGRYDTFQKTFAMKLSRLEALSPLAVMTRGYSVTRRLPEQKVVRSVDDLALGGQIETILGDGRVESKVDRIEKKRGV